MWKRLSILCMIAGLVLGCDGTSQKGISVVRLENVTIAHYGDSISVDGTVIRGKITKDGRDTTYTDTTHVHNLVITRRAIQSRIHKERVGEFWEEMTAYLLLDLAQTYMDTLETKAEADAKKEKTK